MPEPGSTHTAPVAPEETLARVGVRFERYAHPATLTVEDIQRDTDFPLESSVKTLAFTLGADEIVLAAVPGPARLDYGALARALGVSRSSLKRAEPATVARLGCAAGGLSPVPTTDPPLAAIVFDTRVPDLGWVYCGGGDPTVTLALEASDLVGLWPNARFASISR